METINRVYPSAEQVAGLLEPGPEGPICMVNLPKFKPLAEYADGRESTLTGREAFGLYEEVVATLLQQVGGYLGFVGDVERLVLGEVEELWDTVSLAVWPSHHAMLEVMQSNAMREISVHRAAGLAGQLNIETATFYDRWLEARSP